VAPPVVSCAASCSSSFRPSSLVACTFPDVEYSALSNSSKSNPAVSILSALSMTLYTCSRVRKIPAESSGSCNSATDTSPELSMSSSRTHFREMRLSLFWKHAAASFPCALQKFSVCSCRRSSHFSSREPRRGYTALAVSGNGCNASNIPPLKSCISFIAR